MSADRWKHRPLVVVAGIAADADYQALLERIRARRAAFDEREMILYTVVAEAVSRDGEPLAPTAAERVRQAVGAGNADPVTMILIGKDGSEKMRVAADTPLEAVFDRIDGMPMRQREMRRND